MPRLATASNIIGVHAIVMHPEVVGCLNVEPTAVEEFAPVFDALLKARTLFVHAVEGEVVGVYTMTRWPFRADHVATLGMVAIKPDLAGRGVAQQMMVEAIEGLRAAGIRRVDLNVESGNTRAIAFYKGLGFEIEGTLRRGFRSSDGRLVDDHVMSLLLDEDAARFSCRTPHGHMTAASDDPGIAALRIRRARRHDVPRIVALLADDPLGAGRETLVDPLPQAYWDAFEAIDAAPHEELVVADLDGRIVGCLQLTVLRTLSRAGARRALVEGVRVETSLRGRGIGERLMRYAIERARSEGCRIVQLTTDRSRVDAHRFYERLGFIASHHGMKLALD